ncbi:hypothetical protein LM801050_270021 [Listeria monocytogenes]|nr:hypothetical protein LM701014_450008 [Listeria monocytogenes]CUL19145.1 hypothetical protein LM701398_430021 [Listeria monocytogenes]CUL65910.1 hypothetical protein LM801050_270021 [Listeria monocytogenes]
MALSLQLSSDFHFLICDGLQFNLLAISTSGIVLSESSHIFFAMSLFGFLALATHFHHLTFCVCFAN